MVTSVDIERRWEFLLPWTRILSDRFSNKVCSNEFNPGQIYMSVLSTSGAKAKKTHEGLKLLAAVAYVDSNAWRYLLENHCGFWSNPSEELADMEIIVRFELNLKSKKNLVEICGAHQHERPSREYLVALAQITAMYNNADIKGLGVDISIPIEVVLWDELSQTNELHELLMLQEAKEMIRREWEEKPSPPVEAGALRCTFVLDIVMNAHLKASQIDLEMAKKVEQLVNDNVRFSHLSLNWNFDDRLKWNTPQRREVLGILYRTLFDTTRRSYVDSPTKYLEPDSHALVKCQQINLFGMSMVNQPLKEWGALCSAAILSQTTRKCYVGNPWNSKHWEWLAYAFFSKRARAYSSLEVLSLRCIESMSTEDIEAFCAILSSEHPEKKLLGSPDGPTGVQDATLATGSPVRWQFDEHNEPVLDSEVLTIDSTISFVRVIPNSEKSEWVDAIVPGYGRCQVRRENLVINEPVNVVPGDNLKALELDFRITLNLPFTNQIDISGLPLFFATIGASLETLTIDTEKVDVDWNIVLERCPNLMKLCVTQKDDAAVLNFSEFHAARLPLPAISFRLDDVPAFSNELMNPNSALTKCLRSLTIYRWGRWFSVLNVKPMLKLLLKMLKKNDYLEYLHITMDSKFEKYMKQLRKFHLQPLNRSDKVNVQVKTALLTVLFPTRRLELGGNHTTVGYFDENVVKNMFEFIAPPALRKVYVDLRQTEAGGVRKPH